MAWAKKDHSGEIWVMSRADFFRAFFKTGENPNEVDENGNSLLANYVSSAKKGRIADALPAFIEAGVDREQADQPGRSNPAFLRRRSETD